MAVSDSSDQGFKLKHQLKALLERHNMSAAELSRKSGVPKQVLSLWLGGVEPRKLSQLKKVAEVFAMSVDELCFGRMPASQPDWIEGTFIGRIRRLSNQKK